MANEMSATVVPKKRGRPPGAKKAKKAAKGIRYDADRQKEIVSFILAQGRGGMSKAKVKFGVSFPTLARWVKQAGSDKGSSKVKQALMKIDRTPKSATASSGHVLISKKVLKELQKGIANLEAAFGAISNALRVLE